MGRLFQEFAVTIMVAILISGFVSLSLTPMMGSRFLRHEQNERHGRFYNTIESFWNKALHFYESTLAWVVERRRAMMLFSLAIFIITIFLFVMVPKGFLPSEDTGYLNGSFEGAEGTSFEGMLESRAQVTKILGADPNIERFTVNIGGGGGGGANSGRMNIRLKPRSERSLTADQLANDLRRKMAVIPGIRVFVVNPPVINVGGRFASGLYQFTMQSADIKGLYAAAPLLESRLRADPMFRDVNSDLRISNPEVTLTIDRDRAASLGISPQTIEEALYSAYGTRQVSTILAPNNQYYVMLELNPEYQRDASAFQYLYVRSPQSDRLVPLATLATIKPTAGPLTVNHSGQLPSVTISFNLDDGVALSEGVAAVMAAAREVLPATIATSFSGTAQAFQSSQSSLLGLLLLAILVIYMILGILYESFIHPLTILSGLPFAGFGALITLLLFKMDLNLYSFVGLIMLIGVVKKNAIMMIDFAISARNEGLSARDAILQACSIRFRPIMMTTVAALMATLPIALGLGAGSESRRPLGLCVVGGLLFSQLITLYVTPVFYIYLEKLQNRLGSVFARKENEV